MLDDGLGEEVADTDADERGTQRLVVVRVLADPATGAFSARGGMPSPRAAPESRVKMAKSEGRDGVRILTVLAM